ncbi:putative UBX domain protein (Ubx5) [Scedosporium apiospermum]|uniref:Putative UBX domain protein (Ubx5) n=1 Tax=Pseudallescheria apiosperma TaxID=563466 RepID=A0A084GGI0_PSEDA|nr:putative UBX domain protein (Ubx5) [Scedosporium apiospermum]KEZ46442.1 putative UBX domain protein (Ubx5) [Scedosporium apiospermum]
MADATISSFVDITGSSANVARGFLEMTNNDLEQAIQLFFENPDLQHSINSASATTQTTTRNAPSGTHRQTVREDEHGVIHIDSDDDEDEDVDSVQAVARNAQEEEDAAMAQRLQEELFSAPDDEIRSPIRSTTETLVAPHPAWGSGFDGDDDIQSDLLEQLRQRQARARRAPNPFNQSIWDDPDARPGPATAGAPTTRAQRLTDLFRPPHDIISRFSWDEAREEGKDTKKWILVNIQDLSDFTCQALNRDIWKDKAIKELVAENFIFLQYSNEDVLARDYITFYFPNHENPQNYPHVSIVDPRTGEQVKIWSGRPFPSALDFHSQLVEFLDRYSLNANTKNPVVKVKSKQSKAVDVDRMTEEEMLEMALKNSLAPNGGSSENQKSNIVDPDSLTKSPLLSGGERVTSPLREATAEPELSASQSAFAAISITNPHTEPEHNPATTTRIQFRHATGRIIRRFNTQDPVRRIYEWLKAEPMEGKEGVEFELKKMPQGHDLIENLDGTIEEVGLKQGTVMIEFLE